MASDDRLLSTPPFCVAGREVHPPLLEVRRGTEARTLEPKVMGVLCHLARRAGTAVSRRELLDEGWPDTVVGDETLTRCVSELRKAFGDDARAPTVIGTVPRVGYRLLAPVAWLPAEPPAPPDASAAAVPDPSHERPRTVRPGVVFAAAAVLAVLAYSWFAGGFARPSSGEAAPVLPAPPLTSTPGFERSPTLSPDGAWVAYVSGTARTGDLVVLPVREPGAGGEPLRLVTADDLAESPRWSPDGAQIAYIDWIRDPSRWARDPCVLAVVPAFGGPPRVVAPCPGGAARTLDWTADGRALLVGGDEAGTALGLSLVDLASGETRALDYDRPPGAVDDTPRASPDGRRVLFLRAAGAQSVTLSVLDLETGSVTPLATGTQMMAGHDWLSAGGAVYALAQASRSSLWRLATTDGTADPALLAVEDPGVFPDVAGGRLVFERWRVEADLFALDLARPPGPDSLADLVPFAPSTAFDAHPQISPDGRRVAFVSERSGTPQVWVAERDGSRPRAVTDLPGVVGAARWSPDGTRLAFATRGGADADVYVIDGLGEPPRRLASPGWNEAEPAWSADGAWLYVASDRSGQTEVWRLPAGGGEGTQLTFSGAKTPQPSPTGGQLYTMRPGRPGLWQRTGEDGEDEVLLPDLDPRYVYNWAPAADGVVFAHRRPGWSHETLESSASPERPLVVLPRGGVVFTLALSPEGTSAVVSRIGEREVDLAAATLPDAR
ncbi:MAG: winged helix-turn-helix domain-containing protein [Bacteroidota bacterium]